MKTKNIFMASILLVVAIVIGSLVVTYFSYNNREIALRQQAEAQRGKIEGVHDKMWKIIQQKAQVTVDVRRPVGDRVLSIRYGGEELSEERQLTLCLNNYRATGTGGYDVYRTCELVRTFASLDEIKNAEVEDLKKIPSMDEKSAKSVYNFFRGSEKEGTEATLMEEQ